MITRPSSRTSVQPINLVGLKLTNFEAIASDLNEAPYHAGQLFRWVYARGATDFAEMTDLSLRLRQRLAERYAVGVPTPAHHQTSPDGTEKMLFRDGDDTWETVLMRDADRRTVCVSSQSGCALGCKFCATAQLGLRRNLTTAEMVGQVMAAGRLLPETERVTNVVFMGMGEPLQNYERVKDALDLLSDEAGLAISHRRTTVSTVGLVPQMYRWAEERTKANLAISLIAPNDELRSELMPINRRFPLAKLKEAAIAVTELTGRRVTFEYVLMDGLNDSIEHAKQLVSFIHGIACKINLIRCHPNPDSPYRRPPEDRVIAFRDYLYPRAPAVSIRKSFGVDIDAACGQLAGRTNSSATD